eukprot:snap_masked-scaffold_59-processed-gene-0.33-mRNA-1 protein AED:0.34 eAED:0.54 QI:0/0/0/1/1/1/3/0/76
MEVFFYYSGFINVLDMMVIYYLLRTFNIKIPRVMKMMVTNLQIIQFVSMQVHGAFIAWNNGEYPVRLAYLYLKKLH